jgi:hypothetical protein
MSASVWLRRLSLRCLRVGFHPHAAADEVAVAVDVVHAADGGPEFGLADELAREGGGLARVGPRPFIGGDDLRGVRGVFERVVGFVGFAGDDGLHLAVDGDHRIAETVELDLRFALGRFDHERAGDGERQGRGVVAVIHETLGGVFGFDAVFLPAAQIDDALVGDQAGCAAIKNREIVLQAGGDVVGVEDGDFGGLGESVGAHHADIHPRDNQDGRAAPRRGGDGAEVLAALVVDGRDDDVTGEERREVRGDADGPHAGAAAAVRDAEGFVEVEVADVGTDVTGGREADLGVHVGAVHVNLAAERVDVGADVFDGGFENAVGGRVGDHRGGEILGVFVGLGLEVGDVDVAVGVAGDGDDRVSAHGGAGGIGAVGAGGDEADVAVTLAARLVEGADDEEAGVFALRAGVGLEGDGGEAGDLGEPGFEVGEELRVALGLVGGGEGVELTELGPGDGEHLAGGVELHRARAERDHRVDEGKVLGLEALDVAEHLVLGVVAVEDRRGEERRGAGVRSGEPGALDLGGERGAGGAEEGDQLLDLLERGGLVERDTDGGGVDGAEVDLQREGIGEDLGRVDVADGERVEDRLGVHGGAGGAEAGGEDLGESLDAAGDFFEAGGTVVDGIHRGHDGEENLRGADVGRGLVAADVLLARAEGEAHGGVAVGVFRHADETAGHLALEGVLGGEERGVGSAETHGNTEALGGTDGDIGAEFAGGAEEGEREQVGGDDGERTDGVGGFEECREIVDTARGVGILHEHAEGAGGGREGFVVADDDLDAEGHGAGFDDVDGLRVALFGDEKRAVGGGVAFLEAVAHHHGLGGGGALVEHGGVGDFEAGQVGDERLEVEEGFEAALGDFGLVGGVGGIPARVFQDGALDDAGCVGVVVAHADVAAENLVLRGEAAEFGEGGGFTEGGGEVEGVAADVGRDGGVDQCVEGRLVEGLEHGGLFGGIGTVVAVRKRVGRSEQLGKGRRGGVRGSGHKKRTVGEAYRPANGFWRTV